MKITIPLMIACIVVSALMMTAREFGGWVAWGCVLGAWATGIIYKSLDD